MARACPQALPAPFIGGSESASEHVAGTEPDTIFDTAAAVHSAVSAAPRNRHAANAQPHELSPAAQAIAEAALPAEPTRPSCWPGWFALIEVALIVAVGFTVYVCYVVPSYGFAWYYFAAIGGIAVLAMLAFQVADICRIPAFRGHEKQYMRLASAWSVVFL